MAKKSVNLEKKKGLTQEQLAEMIDKHERTISRVERALVECELNTLYAISKALDVSLDYLLSGDKAVSKEVYIHEITEKICDMDVDDIEHILGYIEFYIDRKKRKSIDE